MITPTWLRVNSSPALASMVPEVQARPDREEAARELAARFLLEPVLEVPRAQPVGETDGEVVRDHVLAAEVGDAPKYDELRPLGPKVPE